MKRLLYAILFSAVLCARAQQPGTVTSDTGGHSADAAPSAAAAHSLPPRLLYEQLPGAKPDETHSSGHAVAEEPDPLVASSDQTPRNPAPVSGVSAADSLTDGEGLRDEPPLSLRERYNIHGTVTMGFGTGGLLYGGVGVSADLSDNVSLNLGVSTIHWDGDGWYWPVYPFQE